MTDVFPPRPAATPAIYALANAHRDHAGRWKGGLRRARFDGLARRSGLPERPAYFPRRAGDFRLTVSRGEIARLKPKPHKGP